MQEPCYDPQQQDFRSAGQAHRQLKVKYSPTQFKSVFQGQPNAAANLQQIHNTSQPQQVHSYI